MLMLYIYLNSNQQLVKMLSDILFLLMLILIGGVAFAVLRWRKDFRELKEIRARIAKIDSLESNRKDSIDFYYAVTILKDTRFSHILCENEMIYVKALEHTKNNLEYIESTLGFINNYQCKQ